MIFTKIAENATVRKRKSYSDFHQLAILSLHHDTKGIMELARKMRYDSFEWRTLENRDRAKEIYGTRDKRLKFVSMNSKYSNSPIGTEHWFNTTIGIVLRVGEYLENHGPDEPVPDSYMNWGCQVEGIMKEHMEWRKSIRSQATDILVEVLTNTAESFKKQA